MMWLSALECMGGVVVCLYSFYFVTDLRLVPAIKKVCEHFHIPDDVAGATVLGAALNAPELFTAMISTLATDNDVGIGIVMGSFNFNIFIVTGVVALVARRKLRSRQLKIEWLFLQRDVYFYAIGVGLIVLFCKDSVLDWYENVIMVVVYILYVVICLMSKKLTKYLCPNRRYKPRRRKDALLDVHEDGSVTITLHPKDSARSLTLTKEDLHDGRMGSIHKQDEAVLESLKVQDVDAVEDVIFSSSKTHQSFKTVLERMQSQTKPYSIRTPLLESRSIHNFSETLSRSFSDPVADMAAELDHPLSQNEKKQLIHLAMNPEGTVNFDLRLVTCAQDKQDKQEWATDALQIAEEIEIDEIAEEYHAEHLLAWPTYESGFAKAMYCLNFPFNAIVHFTIPSAERWCSVCIVMSTIWLAGISFVLSILSKNLGDALEIPDKVVGLTLDSVGTSLPNVLAAVMAGKGGNSEIAICQAFGSNTFDALVAFGFVELLKSCMVGFKPIHINAQGVVQDGIINLGMLLVYVWFLYFFRLRLTRCFGVICLAMYAIWLSYQLYTVYKPL